MWCHSCVLPLNSHKNNTVVFNLHVIIAGGQLTVHATFSVLVEGLLCERMIFVLCLSFPGLAAKVQRKDTLYRHLGDSGMSGLFDAN